MRADWDREGDPQDGERQRPDQPASWRTQARRRPAGRAPARCRRCGRKLTARYPGRSTTSHAMPAAGATSTTESRAASPSEACGWTTPEAALLQVVQPGAIAAAVAAEAEASCRRDQVREALTRDLEAAGTQRTAPSASTMPLIRATPGGRGTGGALEQGAGPSG